MPTYRPTDIRTSGRSPVASSNLAKLPTPAPYVSSKKRPACSWKISKFYKLFRRDPDFPASITDTYHIYFCDPDLDEAEIEVNEGQAFRYFAPDQLDDLEMPTHARAILKGFFESAQYRKLFH